MADKVASVVAGKRPEVITALASAIRGAVSPQIGVRISDEDSLNAKLPYAGYLSFVLPGVPVVLTEKKHHFHLPVTIGCSCHGHNHDHADEQAYAEVRTPDRNIIFQAGRPVLECMYSVENDSFHIHIESDAVPEKRGKPMIPSLPIWYKWFDVRQELMSAIYQVFGEHNQPFKIQTLD